VQLNSDEFLPLVRLPCNIAEHPWAIRESAQSKERYIQLLIAIEVVLMVVLALKVSIGNFERELKRKPIRYDDND
jgi:hypothetical protein